MRIRFPLLPLLLVLLAPVAGGSCATEQPLVWVSNVPAPEMKPDGVIRPRDSIVTVVRDHADLSGEFTVRDDGGVVFPLVGDVHFGGVLVGSENGNAVRQTRDEVHIAGTILPPLAHQRDDRE